MESLKKKIKMLKEDNSLSEQTDGELNGGINSLKPHHIKSVNLNQIHVSQSDIPAVEASQESRFVSKYSDFLTDNSARTTPRGRGEKSRQSRDVTPIYISDPEELY